MKKDDFVLTSETIKAIYGYEDVYLSADEVEFLQAIWYDVVHNDKCSSQEERIEMAREIILLGNSLCGLFSQEEEEKGGGR